MSRYDKKDNSERSEDETKLIDKAIPATMEGVQALLFKITMVGTSKHRATHYIIKIRGY